MNLKSFLYPLLITLFICPALSLGADNVFPPLESLATVRPRLLVRGDDSTGGVSLSRLRSDTLHAEFQSMLAKLRQQESPACRALLWLMRGDSAMADSAVAALKRYRYSKPGDTFDIYFTLFEYGLAYDWVRDYGKFTSGDRAAVRAQFYILANTDGLGMWGDHIFHNYVWMSACGTAIWALATAGEDTDSDQLYNRVRTWLNDGLYPGMRYMDGLPGESLGYWSQYDFTGAVWTVLAARSASGQDITGRIATEYGDWLRRQFMNEIHSVQPDMRFLPWGDVVGGPNGSVTHEMAGVLDAAAWALNSGEGVRFSNWLAGKRGTGRFYGMTSMYYMLYTKHLSAAAVEPSLSFTAGGGEQGGHFIARSGWDDGATVLGFGVKDHYGDHNHYDQGGFIIYRNGYLAADPTLYSTVNGPQQPSDVHSTLILKGASASSVKQREPHGQRHGSLEDFKANLKSGQLLDTGDFLFSAEGGNWAAAAGQYAQAYPAGLVKSVVRQVLFIRPGTLLVVDQLKALSAGSLTSVDWLVQFAQSPVKAGAGLSSSNGKSWLKCRPVYPDTAVPTVQQVASVSTWRASYRYTGRDTLVLVHVLEVGDSASVPDTLTRLSLSLEADSIRVETADYIFSLARGGSYGVSGLKKKPPRQAGDVNGDSKLDVFDLLSLLKALAGSPSSGTEADVNADGKADVFDLLALLKKLAGG